MKYGKNQGDFDTSTLEEKDKNKILAIILLLLLLLLFITTYLVMFLIGRKQNEAGAGGIDAGFIVLSPEGDESRNNFSFHLLGQVLYSDGTPYAGKMVEIHSTPRSVLTDEEGRFMFDNVEEGWHQILVPDEAGNVLASCSLEITASSNENGQIDIFEKKLGSYRVEASLNVRALEINLKIGEGDTEAMNKLVLDYMNKKWLTQDQILITSEGRFDTKLKNGVTPLGFVVLTNGKIVWPGKSYIDKEEVKKEIFSDVTLSDGTILTPEGDIILPGVGQHAESVQDAEGENMGVDSELDASNSDQSSGEFVPPLFPSKPFPDEGGKLPPYPGSGGGGSVQRPEVPETSPPETIPPETTPSETTSSASAEINVYQPEEDGTLTDWTQISRINLFGKRKGEEPVLLYPGVEGAYDFVLENSNDKEIEVEMSLSDTYDTAAAEARKKTEPLVLEFRMRKRGPSGGVPTASDWLAGGENKWLSMEAFSSTKFRIEPKDKLDVILEWRWPYERGNDAAETKMGIQASIERLEYYLRVQLRAFFR